MSDTVLHSGFPPPSVFNGFLLQFSVSFSWVLYLNRPTMSAIFRFFNIRDKDVSVTYCKISSVMIRASAVNTPRSLFRIQVYWIDEEFPPH